MTTQLVPTHDGWWILSNGQIAHLPPEAVDSGALVQEARGILDAQDFFDDPRPDEYSVTVLTATTCNLGCAYCFQNMGETEDKPFAPQRIKKALLDAGMVAKIQWFVERQIEMLGKTELALLLFGGEPLLNPRNTLLLLERLQPIGLVNAEMVSNTVLLTPALAQELRGAGLGRIQVTFDGNRADHDQIRVDHRGRPTYDRILTNVSGAAATTDLDWQFRVNVSHHTLGGIDALVDDIARIRTPNPATIRLALIDDVGVGYQNKLRYDDVLAKKFIEVIEHAIGVGLEVDPIDTSLADCPFCGQVGGQTGAVINADGTLYSCWETAGRPEWSVGDVSTGYYAQAELAPRWVACDYATSSHGEASATAAFYRTINAFILDRTYRTYFSAPIAAE